MKWMEVTFKPSPISVCFQFLAALFFIVSLISKAESSGVLRVPDAALNSDSLVEVVVFMEQDDSRAAARAVNQAATTRQARIKAMLAVLNRAPGPGSAEVESYLLQYSSNITHHRIIPAYTVTLPATRLSELARLPGIKRIIPNVQLELVTPISSQPAPLAATGTSTGLSSLKVPALWQQGITGRGRLVCSFDTGVEEGHPALSSKWRGRHAPLSASWFSTVKPDSLPSDRINHGTHTMGVMVGSHGSDTVGVAPDAEWITAGIIDQGKNLNSTISDILLAFEWVLNPDGDTTTTDDVPDVILNSWGIPSGLFADCDDTFWGVIDNVEAAGIVTIFAAGNEGPNAGTVRNPADRPTSPTNSFSVGAVDDAGVIAGFSSRGPSTCDPTRVKPEVVAPGVQIRSSVKGGGYGFMSGSSMAAPYVAGLVALCRQYNPNATVEQIKMALIAASQDLGPVGPDNSYGHGLIDASKLLNFLPAPSAAVFGLAGRTVSGDGVGLPGETFGLTVFLSNVAGNTPIVYGRLKPVVPSHAVVMAGRVQFLFGNGGTLALGATPFVIDFDPFLIHGEEVRFQLYLEDLDGVPIDSLPLLLTVGYPPPGLVASHDAGKLGLTVSDFGQFGFAPGSAYNLGGSGFRLDGGDNLLYSAGVIVARNELLFSSAVRDSQGRFAPSDFSPVQPVVEEIDYQYGGRILSSRYTDTGSEIPIPITVAQQTIDYGDADAANVVILRFNLVNQSLEPQTGVSFGFLADFDLGTGEEIVLDKGLDILYQVSGASEYVGVVPLKNVASFTSLSNESGKIGLSPRHLMALMTSGADSVGLNLADDGMFLVAAGPFNLAAGDSVEVAFALLATLTLDQLFRSADIARERFDVVTSLEEDRDLLPGDFVLRQNYPNPFNPATNIAFSLQTSARVRLEVFNLLGQIVQRQEVGRLPAGEHMLVWDGMTNSGNEAASGLYFYRVTAGSLSRTLKMMLVR